jgi:hypothetical protein
MKRQEAIDKIMADLHFPAGWMWYVKDVLDRKVPDQDTIDKATVESLKDFIKIDIRS